MNLDIIEANRRVHSSLILSGDYQKSPHRSQTSVHRVRSLLSKLNTSSDKLIHLDIGCGDGFIFECKPDNWESHGVDATSEMLAACAKNHPEVALQKGYAESLAFDSSTFDIVTCYSFLDHLDSTERFYAEAFRVLKPGGIFYFGLSPNRDFYNSLILSRSNNLSEYLSQKVDIPLELKKAFDDGAYYEELFGINQLDLLNCEPGKSKYNGLAPQEEYLKIETLGVSSISIVYEWVFQQNRIELDVLNTLKNFLPFTKGCFKYFDLMGIK